MTQIVQMNPFLHPFHCLSVFSITEEKDFSLIIDITGLARAPGLPANKHAALCGVLEELAKQHRLTLTGCIYEVFLLTSYITFIIRRSGRSSSSGRFLLLVPCLTKYMNIL